MGSWGAGLWDNDDAGEFAHRLSNDKDGLALVLQVLSESTKEEFLSSSDACVVLAAADLIRGLVMPDQANETDDEYMGSKWDLNAEHVLLARDAVTRVIASSELQELMDGDEDWLNIVADLEADLDEALSDDEDFD